MTTVPRFATVAMFLAIVPALGCSARRVRVSGDLGISPDVKWLFQSGDRFEWGLGFILALRREDFSDAGLFGNRLVLCSWVGGCVTSAPSGSVYVVDPINGKLCYSLFPPSHVRTWEVADDLLILTDRRAKPREQAYDLDSGQKVDPRERKARAQSTLRELSFQRGPDPQEEGHPNFVYLTSMFHITPRLRLIQKSLTITADYQLFLEKATDDWAWHRSKLTRLRGASAAIRAWAGHDASGDYIIVLGNGFAFRLSTGWPK